jgi:hypothetical protein
MQPHEDKPVRQHTQQNEQGNDHSMTLGSGVADSMIQKKFLFNRHFYIIFTVI